MPDILKDIYTLVYETVIVYGSTIWYNGNAKEKIKVLQIQRTSLLGITKLPHYSMAKSYNGHRVTVCPGWVTTVGSDSGTPEISLQRARE